MRGGKEVGLGESVPLSEAITLPEWGRGKGTFGTSGTHILVAKKIFSPESIVLHVEGMRGRFSEHVLVKEVGHTVQIPYGSEEERGKNEGGFVRGTGRVND